MSETAFVICLEESVNEATSRAVEILNGAQNVFDFRLVHGTVNLPSPDLYNSYSWNLLSSLLKAEKSRLKADYIFGVLSQPIQFNWFSRTLDDENICFITIKDWEYLSHLPISAYISYEIAENLAEMLLDRFIAHKKTRGCMFDMVRIKPHISFKIRTADICPECLELLQSKLQPQWVNALITMLEDVRRVALGRQTTPPAISGSLSLPETVDQKFPFPLAYCFRSMQSELSWTRKFYLMLELFEAIIKYTTFVLIATLPQAVEPHFEQTSNLLNKLSIPATGDWHSACFGLLRTLRKSSSPMFVKSFLDALTPAIIKRAYEASEHFVGLRNDTRGHGTLEHDPKYQQLYEENLDRLQILLEFTAPLANYQLIKVGENLRQRRGHSTFPAKLMMGSNSIFPVKQYETAERVDTDCLLQDPITQKYLSLYPWLIVAPCKECHREVLFLYDKIKDNQIIIREYPTNHKQKRDDLTLDVKSGLGID